MQNKSSCMDEVFFALCKGVDTPYSLGCWLRYKYERKLLLDLEIDPRNYNSISTFRGDYLVYSYLSKYKCFDFDVDLKEEALRKFATSEVVCKATNERIRSEQSTLPGWLAAVIHSSQRKIARLLGPYSTFLLTESYGWGPGATSDISRRRAFVDTKMLQTPISVTRRALPALRREIAEDLHWSSGILNVAVGDIHYPFCFLPHVFNVTEDCIIDTVPKNSKTDRVIAKENTGNGFLQKGFGAYFRSRMKSVGVDLNDQTANQDAACAAYADKLSTLDLKAASDTVAKELVFLLLPVDWALALDDVRSHSAKLPSGESIRLEKFSSMGNGFTFELESLIFWAISSSVSDLFADGSRVWVYGDDIIVHRECSQRLVEALSWFGFTVNPEKSFLDGCFFESCGKHYFGGEDVTPVYQKEDLSDGFEAIRGGNRLIRYAARAAHWTALDKSVFQAWQVIRRNGDPTLSSFQIPLGEQGDDGWVVPASLFNERPQDANLGLRCRVLRPVQQRFPAADQALLAWSLRRGVETESPFMGELASASKERVLRTCRWVMPTYAFGLDW